MSRFLSGKRPYGKKIVPIVLLMLLLSGLGLSAHAMWSPEILLWEDQPGGRELATLSASIIIDSLEHVHILYVHMFDPPAWDPHMGPLYQVNYTGFDGSGRLMVPDVMLSDSGEVATLPHLQFYSSDSLCVMWDAVRDYPPVWDGLEYRVMNLDGAEWGPIRHLLDSSYWANGPLNFAFQIRRADQALVAAWTDGMDGIRLEVLRPDGSRPIDRALVWISPWQVAQSCYDRAQGFIDYQDSLQLMWREYPDWMAVLAKRVSIYDPPVSGDWVHEYAPLTPIGGMNRHGPGKILPLGDSLLIFSESDANSRIFDPTIIHVVRRSDYSEVSQAQVGRATSDQWDIEPGGILGIVTYTDTLGGPQALERRYRRFTLPYLTCIEDSLFMLDVDPKAYAVSPSGVRHVIYERWRDSDRTTHLYYRYWRADLAADKPARTTPSAVFTVAPNPSTGQFTLRGPLERATDVRLYNILGQCVRHIAGGASLQGKQSLTYDLDGLPNGVYFLHVTTPGSTYLKKVLLIH